MARLIPDEQTNHNFKAFLEVANAWNLTGNERAKLIRAATSSISRWTNEPDRVGLDQDQHARVRLLLTIHEILSQIFDEQTLLREFLHAKQPCNPFNYRSLLGYMLEEGEMEDLILARNWLTSTVERGLL